MIKLYWHVVGGHMMPIVQYCELCWHNQGAHAPWCRPPELMPNFPPSVPYSINPTLCCNSFFDPLRFQLSNPVLPIVKVNLATSLISAVACYQVLNESCLSPCILIEVSLCCSMVFWLPKCFQRPFFYPQNPINLLYICIFQWNVFSTTLLQNMILLCSSFAWTLIAK